MSEKTLEKKLREKIKNMGGLALKFWAVSYTGMPDRLVLMPHGNVCFAEIKSKGKKATPQQAAIHKRLKKLGFDVFIIDDALSLQKCIMHCLPKKLVSNNDF